jgi:hypothetical protein
MHAGLPNSDTDEWCYYVYNKRRFSGYFGIKNGSSRQEAQDTK